MIRLSSEWLTEVAERAATEEELTLAQPPAWLVREEPSALVEEPPGHERYLRLVRDALDAVTAEDRELFTLAALAGVSIGALAARYGLAEGDVAARVSRAQEHFDRALGQRLRAA